MNNEYRTTDKSGRQGISNDEIEIQIAFTSPKDASQKFIIPCLSRWINF